MAAFKGHEARGRGSSVEFSIWHPGGSVEARLYLQTKLYAHQTAVGRVTELAPILHGCLDLSTAHRGGRSRWIFDLAIGDPSRAAMIRAAVGVAVRHLSSATFAIVARGEVAEALGDMPLRLFANAVEARRWLAGRTPGLAWI